MAISAAASHLPATNTRRGAGLTSSGSSEPRSRSPAVESVAICIPPTKRRHDDEHRNEGQDLRGPLLRRRDLDVFEVDGGGTPD